ncbi:MAG: DUF2975 domain-containing protein [Actinobacteria bacterium]|nr:DUF2975 domain-containing protein [Actinomycetota bacterium]
MERPETVPVTVRIEDARPNQVFVALGRDLIAVSLVVVMLWLLRLLSRSVRDGDPFTAANVRRLRAIGFLLVVGAPIATLASRACDQWLASTSTVGELGSGFTLPGAGPVAGLGVFVLAEVFAHGARLRADVEGTV